VRLFAISGLLLSCVVVGCSKPGTVMIISELDEQSLPDDTSWRRVLSVAAGWPVTFSFEKTTKGNGTLTFPGGCAGIYDCHDDGITFAPYLLRARLEDLDRDGYADIEISGTAVFHDERGAHELGRHPVRAVFKFIPSKHRFVKTVSDPAINTCAR